jgi:hypothetical protein
MGLLEAIDAHESRIVDPGNLRGTAVPRIWSDAVPGLVGGFMARGACGLSGGGRDGWGSFGLFGDFDTGLGGSGLFGGSDGLPIGLVEAGAVGAGGSGKSFAGGSGGIAIVGPLPALPIISCFLALVSEGSTLNSFSRSMSNVGQSTITTGGTSTHGGDAMC